jgi:hypothetical protein
MADPVEPTWPPGRRPHRDLMPPQTYHFRYGPLDGFDFDARQGGEYKRPLYLTLATVKCCLTTLGDVATHLEVVVPCQFDHEPHGPCVKYNWFGEDVYVFAGHVT